MHLTREVSKGRCLISHPVPALVAEEKGKKRPGSGQASEAPKLLQQPEEDAGVSEGWAGEAWLRRDSNYRRDALEASAGTIHQCLNCSNRSARMEQMLH
jgi:hypothetical protein